MAIRARPRSAKSSSMAFDTVRTNKMRSGLTVLGVVIGITSIVGMTAMIRGFDQSLRDMIRAIGPNTIFVQRFGVTSFANGAEFKELLKRPNLTISDARALEEQSDDDPVRRHRARRRPGPPTQRRVFYRDQKTKPLVVFGTARELRRGHAHPDPRRPVLQRHRSAVPQERRRARQHRRTSCCSSRAAPIRSARSCASAASASRWSACSTSGRRPAASTSARTTSSSSRYTTYQRDLRPARRSAIGRAAARSCRSRSPCCRATACRRTTRWPTSSASCASATACKLDEPNDRSRPTAWPA